MRPDVAVRIVQPHIETEDGYHQWVTLGQRVKANRLGYSSPRMCFTEWTKWVCNSGDCPAWALVSDAFLADLLDSVAIDAKGVYSLPYAPVSDPER